MAALYPGEHERRVALLRRLRELLLEQRGKFERYLTVLDHEKADIENGDIDKLSAHVEMEEALVSEIFTFQRAIDPLEELYRSAFSPNEAAAHELPAIRGALNELTEAVSRKNAENRSLLRARMDVLRNQIVQIRRPLQGRASVYASGASGGMLDITG